MRDRNGSARWRKLINLTVCEVSQYSIPRINDIPTPGLRDPTDPPYKTARVCEVLQEWRLLWRRPRASRGPPLPRNSEKPMSRAAMVATAIHMEGATPSINAMPRENSDTT